MSGGCFIRTLWGDELTQCHPGNRPQPGKMRADVRVCAERKEVYTSPLVNYAFGLANFRFLRKLDLNPVMLSEEWLLGCLSGEDRNPDKRGWVNWGRNMFQLKITAICHALETYPAVVALDWDVLSTIPEPPDLWERMASGASIQAALMRLKVRSCRWRPVFDDGRWQSNAAFLYVRGRETGKRLQALADEHPTETEEHIAGRLIDEQVGGWKGPDVYKAGGFVPYCYDPEAQGRMVWEPEMVFWVHETKGESVE